jgi:hypothetical protein
VTLSCINVSRIRTGSRKGRKQRFSLSVLISLREMFPFRFAGWTGPLAEREEYTPAKPGGRSVTFERHFERFCGQ